MKKLKIFALICVAAMAAFSMTSCGKGGDDPELTYSIGASTTTLDFGTETEGYQSNPATTPVIITNTGTGTLEVWASEATDYLVGFDGVPPIALAPGETTVFGANPKMGLPAGTHNETLTVNASNGAAPIEIAARFTVTASSPAPTITLSKQKNAVTTGVGAEANYDLSMTDISVGSSLYFSAGATVTWYDADAGGTSIAEPTGVLGYSYVRETDSNGVFGVILAPAIAAGEYFFNVTYEGATSNRAKMTVDPGDDITYTPEEEEEW
jgi:plastocyanin